MQTKSKLRSQKDENRKDASFTYTHMLSDINESYIDFKSNRNVDLSKKKFH